MAKHRPHTTTNGKEMGIGRRLGLGILQGGMWWYTHDELVAISIAVRSETKTRVAKRLMAEALAARKIAAELVAKKRAAFKKLGILAPKGTRV